VEDCRSWIDFEDDLNCASIAVDRYGEMSLREVGERLGVSFVRIKQIEDKLKVKLGKRFTRLLNE
jgi:DNA-directed RNA polymerase sigma subunit (sigma70/sigma32)